jgi:hypothetical protein
LTVGLDNGTTCHLPAEFVQASKPDGSPKLSHAWARTIDGAQGGTWETCHLLGTKALDAYRGYTGQSRSRQPTHTWNTTPVLTVDHGGMLADRRTAAEHVLAALARQPDPTMAARSDPWPIDRYLRAALAEQHAVLAIQPLDCAATLRQADRQLADAEQQLARVRGELARIEQRTGQMGPLSGLSPRRRRERDGLRRGHDAVTAGIGDAEAALMRARAQQAALGAQQAASDRFAEDNLWRRAEIGRLQDQLDHHWAHVIVDCARAGDPVAYGPDRLRHARHTLNADLRALQAQVPLDRQRELQPARQARTDAAARVHRARDALARAQQAVADAKRRRWGRDDQRATANRQLVGAQGDLDRAVAGEHEAEDNLARVRQRQQQRQQVLRATAPERSELTRAVADLDAALDHTRPERVVQLVTKPDADVTHLLGDPPDTPAGRAVWCHHALAIETIRDRNPSPDREVWSQLSQACGDARRDIALAVIANLDTGAADDPGAWSLCAARARDLGQRPGSGFAPAEPCRGAQHRPEVDIGL